MKLFYCSEPSCMKKTTGIVFQGEHWQICPGCFSRLRLCGEIDERWKARRDYGQPERGVGEDNDQP